jgi:predicted  nucleic acid-binding Zn-ribbon protein
MSTDPQAKVNGWTVEQYAENFEALRKQKEEFESTLRHERERFEDALHVAQEKFENERDRGYANVAEERAKALVIQKTADDKALDLAGQNQLLKDEKAQLLSETFIGERGLYATKVDLQLAVKPLTDFNSSSRGQGIAAAQFWGALGTVAMLALAAGAFLHSLIK